jgi:long-chain acyl-CoA synthetase
MALVHELEIIAKRRPHAAALAWRAARWTYADLLASIGIVADALNARGVPRGGRVGLLIRNSPYYVAAYYAALATGRVAVPLNVQERAPVLAKQVADSEASVVMGDADHPEWPALGAALGGTAAKLVAIRLADGGESMRALADALAMPDGGGVSVDASSAVEDDALAAIVYTSGTTGRPKGVMLSHANLLANTRAVIASLGLTAGDHSLCVLPFHFSYGNSVLHSHLLCGARLTLEDNFAFPQLMLQRLQDERVSGFAGVPSTFALLLGRQRLQDFDLSGLRYVTQAGGPMPAPLVAKLREQLPRTSVFLMYGQTEATARLTCLPPEDLDKKPGSVGRPIAGVEIEIREHGRRAEPGRVGEICARGPNVMLGYWKDPAATAEVLSDGWLRTRDVGYLDEDGYLFIVGRTTDMIKVGAFRVGPQEIEEIIAGIDGVQEAGVVGIPDDVLGQAIKAVIVLRPGAALTAMAVKAHCRQNLASYKIPKVIEFAAALPRTSSGKVQRFKLAGEQGLHEI